MPDAVDREGLRELEYMLMPLKRYARFRGRARRREYWMWLVFVFGAFVVLTLVDGTLGIDRAMQPDTADVSERTPAFDAGFSIGTGLTGLFLLAILLPQLAVQVRRLHDTNKSGWWAALPTGLFVLAILATAIAPIVGGILLFGAFAAVLALFVLSCIAGDAGTNRFGPDPKNPHDDLTSVFR